MESISYFLGGNTAAGFHSCYEHFCTPDEAFLYILKGGPGCGKSSFMRKIGAAAEAAGYSVEYVRCSGDPDSLDGVFIPERGLGYMDGTAPHTAEPSYPGICGAYLDLGKFYDTAALAAHKEPLLTAYSSYRSHYQKAYFLLSRHQKDSTRAVPFHGKKRFLSAITCQDVFHLPWEGNQMYVDENELAELLRDGGDFALLHPLWPETIVGLHKDGTLYRVNLQLPDLTEATQELRKAKAVHDELEAIYNPHTDFSGVYSLAQRHIEKYL